jgi:hypothetical protein
MRSRLHRAFYLAAVLCWPLCQRVVADPAVAQAICVTQPIEDEWGERLEGQEPDSGAPAPPGDLVQVLQSVNQNIYPPDVNGHPHANNVLLATTRIGIGVSPSLGRSGMFSCALTPRPGGNARLFVRVFNAATLSEATFYTDSQLFTVKGWKNEIFYPAFSATIQPLDSSDTDQDGLNASWEKSLGSDPNRADTDGDGLSDAEEQLARTDPLDAVSVLQVASLVPAADGGWLVCWDAIAGSRYRIEVAAGEMNRQPEFLPAVYLTATGRFTCATLPRAPNAPVGTVRVVCAP